MSLTKWFKEDWVDIGSPKKGGGYKKCGRKRAKPQGVGGKPTNVKTFAKNGGMIRLNKPNMGLYGRS